MAHPRKYQPDHKLIERLRKICLSFPDTYEKEGWGECTFRVERGTMFAMTDCDHHGSGHTAVWVKAPPLAQETLVEKDAKRFFRPPYMGPKGWVGVKLHGRPNWKELGEILRVGYEMSVPAARSAKKKSAGKKRIKKKSV